MNIYRICLLESDPIEHSAWVSSELTKDKMEDLVAWVQFYAEEYWSDPEISLPSEVVAYLVSVFSASDLCEASDEAIVVEEYTARESRAEDWFNGNLAHLRDIVNDYCGNENAEDDVHFATESFAA